MGFSVTVSRCGTTVEAQYRAGRHTVLYCAVLYCAILYCTVVAYSSFELCPVHVLHGRTSSRCVCLPVISNSAFGSFFKSWGHGDARCSTLRAQHRTVEHTVLYCTVLYCIVLCSVVMWYSVLSCSVPYKSSMHTRSSATVPKLTGYNTP